MSGTVVVFAGEIHSGREARKVHTSTVRALAMYRLSAGSDGRFVRHSLETGAEAIVLEGTGRGNANDQVVEAV